MRHDGSAPHVNIPFSAFLNINHLDPIRPCFDHFLATHSIPWFDSSEICVSSIHHAYCVWSRHRRKILSCHFRDHLPSLVSDILLLSAKSFHDLGHYDLVSPLSRELACYISTASTGRSRIMMSAWVVYGPEFHRKGVLHVFFLSLSLQCCSIMTSGKIFDRCLSEVGKVSRLASSLCVIMGLLLAGTTSLVCNIVEIKKWR